MRESNSVQIIQQDSKNAVNSEFHLPLIENQTFTDEQNQKIRFGTEKGLNVSLYVKAEFNWLQMEQIRMGLKDKVDISVYADPAYSYDTMKQIRLALEDGLSIVTWITDDMYAQQIYEISMLN